MAAEGAAQKMMADLDRDRAEAARMKFVQLDGFEQAVAEQIIPTLVQIKRGRSVVGIGFYQHERWLVSNAHVIRHRADVEAMYLQDQQLTCYDLDSERAFHRPFFREDCPDLVIIKTVQQSDLRHKCMVPDYKIFSGDEPHPESLYFYVELDPNESSRYVIRYLEKLSSENQLPMIYQRIDGLYPASGSSGSPIIEARVIQGREPIWQFRVDSVLYGRCSPGWYNQRVGSEVVSEDTKLLCAIPAANDFQQLLNVMNQEASAERALQMAAACRALGDAQAQRDEQRYLRQNRQYSEIADVTLLAFEAGDSSLSIELPDGLEKLFGDGINTLSSSLLIEENQRLETIKGGEIAHKLSAEETQRCFVDFLQTIAMSDVPEPLVEADGIISDLYFRVDLQRSHKSQMWVFTLQDNTGKGVMVSEYRSKGNKRGEHLVTASSSLAIVKIPLNCQPGNFHVLADDLAKSQECCEEIVISGTAMARYKTVYPSQQPISPRAEKIFHLLSSEASSEQLTEHLNRLPQDRVSRVNAAKFFQRKSYTLTPLMGILQDPQLLEKQSQIKKAEILVRFGALWAYPVRQPDGSVVTARDILERREDKESLQYLLDLKR